MMIQTISGWFERYPIAPLQIQYRPIPQESLLWNDKPLLRHSFLVWDVENISVKCFDSIKALVKFTPEKLYAISKKALSLNNLRFFEEHGFVLFHFFLLRADHQEPEQNENADHRQKLHECSLIHDECIDLVQGLATGWRCRVVKNEKRVKQGLVIKAGRPGIVAVKGGRNPPPASAA